MGDDGAQERNQLSRQDASVSSYRSRSPLAKTGRHFSMYEDHSPASERSSLLSADSGVALGRPSLRSSLSFHSRPSSPSRASFGDPPPLAPRPGGCRVVQMQKTITATNNNHSNGSYSPKRMSLSARPPINRARTISGGYWQPQTAFGDKPPICTGNSNTTREPLSGVPQKNPFFGDPPPTAEDRRAKMPLQRTPKLLATPVEVAAPVTMGDDGVAALMPVIELTAEDTTVVIDTTSVRARFLEHVDQCERTEKERDCDNEYYNRTDDLWIDIDDDELCSEDSSCLRTPSITVPTMPPKSAPPCPQYNGVSQRNGEVSQSNGGTPTIMRHEDDLCDENSYNGSKEYIKHNGLGSSESRLQQSLSTPNPQEGPPPRKDSEYRRFKSEGSSAGTMPAGPEMDGHYDELSPTINDRAVTPHRFNLIQQDSVVNGGPISKQSDTEKVFMMQTLKQKQNKYQEFLDKAFANMKKDGEHVIETEVIESCTIIAKVMLKSATLRRISQDLTTALCDYLQDQNYLDQLVKLFIAPGTCDPVRSACGHALENCLSENNMDYIVNKGWLKKVLISAMRLNKNAEQQRMNMSLIEKFFSHKDTTTLMLIEIGVLDQVLLTCKMEMNSLPTQRHAALALCNMAMHSNSECRKKIAMKRIPEWLFLLASRMDDQTRYYACLAICVLSCTKDMVKTNDTLKLVEPFLLQHHPSTFASDRKLYPGRTPAWLQKLVPMLRQGVRKEARSAASFHFALEAVMKKEQNKLIVFEEIGAIQALKEVAGYPDEVAAKFASDALTVIGEEVPYKLAQQVPSWTISDVQYWVRKIGFEDYVEHFAKQMVDGDLLLHLSERDLERDIKMESGLHRKRFLRELESLKIAADYSTVDDTNLDQLLMSLSPELSVYTYKMLTNGVNRNILPSLTDELMQSACGIENPIHRLKLTQAFRDYKHPDDVEVAMLSKQIDIFISYRRSTGNQLASLIKVLLQLRGYKVFIDVDRLYAGKFDLSLLKNIKAAKHFILVLTPGSMDRLLNDHNKEDWIHKELSCAFENGKNIVPIFEQAFEFPDEAQIPDDIRHITKYNGVRWIHDYQDACVHKVIKFIEGDLNRTPSVNQPMPPQMISVANPVLPRKTHPRFHGSVRQTSTSSNRSRLTEPGTPSPSFTPSNSTEKVMRRKPFTTSVTTAVDR